MDIDDLKNDVYFWQRLIDWWIAQYGEQPPSRMTEALTLAKARLLLV
jgi:hypothetical protein